MHPVVARDAQGLFAQLQDSPPINSCRPSIDLLFESLAEACGPTALVVAMTGMGQDGVRGARAVVDAGGRVLAQDEESSVVWGIPGAVVRQGLAHDVVPLHALGARLTDMTSSRGEPRSTPTTRLSSTTVEP